MNKKLINVYLFILGLILLSFVHIVSSETNVEGPEVSLCILTPPFVLDSPFNLSCEVEKVIDYNQDGNASFNVTFFNNFDYAINDVSLIFDDNSYNKQVNTIGSKNKLGIQTPDIYRYIFDNYQTNYISLNFKLSYTGLEDEQENITGHLIFRVFNITQDEYNTVQEEPEKHFTYRIWLIPIFIVSTLFIYWIIWYLKKKRNKK